MSAESRPTNFLNDGSKSTQEAYYEYQLRQAKLGKILGKKPDGTAGTAPPWLEAQEVAALDEIGEKEKLEIKVLARVSGLSDSSAELLQLKALTGCNTREEIARSLSDIYYRKLTTEQVIEKFVAPSSVKTSIFAAAETLSLANSGVWASKK